MLLWLRSMCLVDQVCRLIAECARPVARRWAVQVSCRSRVCMTRVKKYTSITRYRRPAPPARASRCRKRTLQFALL